MLELLKPCYIALAKYGALALSVIFVLFKFRQSGKEAVINESNEKTLNAVKIRDEIENNINALSDNKFAKLRKKWMRD